jgi:hypothetical protein
MLDRASTVFHDVQLLDQPDPVHALIGDLRTLPEAIRRKTWLYHYGDDWDAGPFDDVSESFRGFVEPWKRYVILE